MFLLAFFHFYIKISLFTFGVIRLLNVESVTVSVSSGKPVTFY